MALKFPKSFEDLDYFIGLTGWLRSFHSRIRPKGGILTKTKDHVDEGSKSKENGPSGERKICTIRMAFNDPSTHESGHNNGSKLELEYNKVTNNNILSVSDERPTW